MRHEAFKGQRRSYVFISIVITLLLVGSFIGITFFLPDYIGVREDSLHISTFQYLKDFILNKNLIRPEVYNFPIGVAHIVMVLLIIILMSFVIFFSARYIIYFLTYKNWIVGQKEYSIKIINASKKNKINDKVAAITYVCNDLTPGTMLQTANQTYKNIDFWILDDSNKPEQIKKNKEFAKKYGFRICARPVEHKKAHPTMIGNMFYFLSQHGKEYDYIFETGASTITTNTFVEHGLCYFNSPIVDTKRLAAVSGCGSFYPAKNFFCYLSGKATQFADAHANGGGLRGTGSVHYVNGWAALYKTSVLMSIPLVEIECPSCDVARSFWLAQHNYIAYQCPFDFSGKLVTQNIYRFKNQRMKWAGGDAFIFKHYWARKYPDKASGLFIKTHYFNTVMFFILTLLFGFIDLIITMIWPQIFFFNFTWLIAITLYGIVFGLTFIIVCIAFKSRFWLLIASAINGIFEGSILFKKWIRLTFYNMIAGKWTSSAVTIKTNEKLTFKQWFKICWFDILWLGGVITACILIQKFFPYQMINGIVIKGYHPVVIWTNFFFFFASPAMFWIISSFLSFVPTKSGWSQELKEFDIAKNDFRYRYVKNDSFYIKESKKRGSHFK